MNTFPVADLTITIGTPEMIEGIDRTPYVATYPDGTWAATYWHPPLPNVPGRTRADWQTVEEFTGWLEWARSGSRA
jgi:hypothetical protein